MKFDPHHLEHEAGRRCQGHLSTTAGWKTPNQEVNEIYYLKFSDNLLV